MIRNFFLFMTSLLLSVSLLSCGDQPLETNEPQSTSAIITVAFPSTEPASARFLSTAKAKGVVGDVTKITITVKNDTTAVVTDQPLTQTASDWNVTLTNLPIGVALTFEAHAVNVTNVEIFNGSTQQTLAETNNTVTLTLAPVDDAAAPTLPKITQIANPAKVIVSKTATVSVQIGGTAGEKLTYQVTAATNGGSFTPASGDITLTGTTATIALTYTAPATLAKYKHTFTLTNAQGNTVSSEFEMEVVQQVTTSVVKVQFNPVITSLKVVRSGTTIIWTATVNDDGAASTLRYLWTFAGKTFVDATTNPATMNDYTESTTGNLVLKVTDGNGTGGSTTLTYALPASQFPDNVALNLQGSTAGMITVPMEVASWTKFTWSNATSTLEKTTEGIKLSCSEYRQGLQFAPKVAYDLSNAEVFMKWKANASGNYSFFYPAIYHVANDFTMTGIGSFGGGSTHHGYGENVLIAENTFYYTRMKINSDKTYNVFTSTGNYDSNGGTVVISKSGTIPDTEWAGINSATFGALFGDNYAPAYMIVSEVIIKKPASCQSSGLYDNCLTYGGHTYGITKTAMTWDLAKTQAETNGGHLAVVDTSAENTFLTTSYVTSTIGPWMGYNDLVTEGSWKWVNGSTATYTNWSPGQPDNSQNEDCGHMFSDGRWNDNQCSASMKAIVEWE
ncbi:lectin-like protein [Deltaproteobacteria bacterium TL4]